MELPMTWRKSEEKLRAFRAGILIGRALAVRGQALGRWVRTKGPTAEGVRIAFARGLTKKAKAAAALTNGEPVVLPRIGFKRPKRLRSNSVLVRYQTGETYHLTGVSLCDRYPEGHFVKVIQLKRDGREVTHFIPLAGKDVVTHVRGKA